MEELKIDKAKCASCELCMQTCPMGIIALDAKRHPYLRTGGPDCMECGQCAAVCPAGAIVSMAARDETVEGGGRAVKEGEFLSFMKNRRSCRSFEKRPVPYELVEKAIDAARYAPSAKNTQPVEWTIVTDEAAIGNLAAALYEKAKANPGLAKRYAFVEAGDDPIYRGAPALVVAHSDPKNVLFPGDGIIAATYFDLAAQALGLGTCWSGTAFSATEAVRSLARIPADHLVHAVFMVGYPAVRFRRLPERKPARVARG